MDAVILASGFGRRFGGNKLLYRIDGVEMYRHITQILAELKNEGYIDEVIMVTQYEEIAERVRQEYKEITVVINDHPENGISSSIKLGIERLRDIYETDSRQGQRNRPLNSEGCMFAVADQPYLTKNTVQCLIETWKLNHALDLKHIAACAGVGRIGNPVIFDARFYDELLSLTGDKGGKRIVKANITDTELFITDDKELEDIDESNAL